MEHAWLACLTPALVDTLKKSSATCRMFAASLVAVIAATFGLAGTITIILPVEQWHFQCSSWL
jgi:hypothetical protein